MRQFPYNKSKIAIGIVLVSAHSYSIAQNSESEIIVVCKDWVAPVYHNNPNIDKIISFSSKDNCNGQSMHYFINSMQKILKSFRFNLLGLNSS